MTMLSNIPAVYQPQTAHQPPGTGAGAAACAQCTATVNGRRGAAARRVILVPGEGAMSRTPTGRWRVKVFVGYQVETGTPVYYFGYALARKEAETQLEWSQEYYRRWHARRHGIGLPGITVTGRSTIMTSRTPAPSLARRDSTIYQTPTGRWHIKSFLGYKKRNGRPQYLYEAYRSREDAEAALDTCREEIRQMSEADAVTLANWETPRQVAAHARAKERRPVKD